MKIEKFKMLLYLKKSGLNKLGKAPIMGRITVNCTMAQFRIIAKLSLFACHSAIYTVSLLTTTGQGTL